MRMTRRWFFSAIKQVQPTPPGLVATIIPPGGRVPSGNLYRVDMQRLGKDLEAPLSSVTSQPMIGGFDVSFNQDAARGTDNDHFQVHAAVASSGSANWSFRSRLAKALRAHKSLDLSVPRPLVVQPLNDPARQLSYLLKNAFFRRLSIVDLPRSRQHPRISPQTQTGGRDCVLARFTFTARPLTYGEPVTRCRQAGARPWPKLLPDSRMKRVEHHRRALPERKRRRALPGRKRPRAPTRPQTPARLARARPPKSAESPCQDREPDGAFPRARPDTCGGR